MSWINLNDNYITTNDIYCCAPYDKITAGTDSISQLKGSFESISETVKRLTEELKDLRRGVIWKESEDWDLGDIEIIEGENVKIKFMIIG